MAAANARAQEKLWTPANIVTMVRICCVPVFVVAILSPWPAYLDFWPEAEAFKPWVAAFVFVLISATDAVDGYLARSRGEVTDFGKFLDPLADKILVAAALLALIELDALPSWPALIILAREFIVSGVRMVAASKGVVIAASWYGKAKTVTQIIAIVLFILKDGMVWESATPFDIAFYVVSWLVMLVAVALTLVSMVDYLVKARDVLGFLPAEKAVPENAVLSTRELAQQVVARATEQGVSLGTAESLTGGLIAGALTEIPGSSAVVRGGVTSYAAEVKRDVLGVEARVIETQGVVSDECSRQMAEGARRVLSCDIVVAVTGIAGPGGEEPGKPVGTVWLALATPSGCAAQEFHFAGSRDEVREATVRAALEAFARVLSD